MFVERDTGAKNYFEVPLAEAHRIFRDAYMQVSGLARTVRETLGAAADTATAMSARRSESILRMGILRGAEF